MGRFQGFWLGVRVLGFIFLCRSLLRLVVGILVCGVWFWCGVGVGNLSFGVWGRLVFGGFGLGGVFGVLGVSGGYLATSVFWSLCNMASRLWVWELVFGSSSWVLD